MATLHTRVLGAAAGGGLPQWNCGCPLCEAARAGRIPGATQSSLAVSADGARWVVFNASPDIRQQIAATPVLQPQSIRDSGIHAVVLTNGDIDHVAGLLSLRESQPFTLYMTASIAQVIEQNPIFNALNPDYVTRHLMAPDEEVAVAPDLYATLFAVPGKVPLYMEERDVPIKTDLLGEQTVGVRLRRGDTVAWYIPGCAAMTDDLAARLNGAALVYFDGTLWTEDEMIQSGTGTKTAKRMGHMAMSGKAGSMAAFDRLDVQQKVYIHINNTNPVLDPRSAERASAERAGWQIAHDGLYITI